MSTKVLFHSNDGKRHCPDGFAAAWAAWLVFDETAEYIPCVYQKPCPVDVKGDNVYILDFSYPRDVLERMHEETEHMIVLDHHKTAQEALDGLSFARFDMNLSGAQMAWEFFHPDRPMPELIRYVADRDLWKRAMWYTEEVHLALSSFPQDFEVWDTLARLPNYADFMSRIGDPLYQKHLVEVRELAASADWQHFAGFKVLQTVTNRYSLVSDALNLICREHPETPFAVNGWQGDDGKVKFDLRSVGDFDVSAIAKELGGGGHRNAAGCVVSTNDPHIKRLLSKTSTDETIL